MSIGGNTINVAIFLKEKNLNIGGMESHAFHFINYFKKENVLKYIIYMKSLEIVDCQTDASIEVKDDISVAEFLKNKKIDILFFNDGHWIESFSTLKKYLPECRLIMRSGGNEIVKAPLNNMEDSLLLRQNIWAEIINKYLDYIVANSAYSINRMLAIGIKKEKIILVRGGVDLEQSKKNVDQRVANRAHFDQVYGTDGKVLLGIVARFEIFKGIQEILSVLKNIQEMNWHLVIAGEGNEADRITAYFNMYFSKNKYTIIGKVDNKQALEFISISDYLLNCSLELNRLSGDEFYIHTETMGRSMMEAISQNTPIIATGVGGTSELFLENPNAGFLVANMTEFEEKIPAIIAKRERLKYNEEIYRYDWKYIFDHIYLPLMKIEVLSQYRRALVLDIDGTITHDFLTADENIYNLKSILGLRNKCCIIINTAGDYEEMIQHYPPIKGCLNDICIIANCGKKLYIYGQECLFWENYEDSLFGPSDALLNEIEAFITNEGYKVIKRNVIDKLYINYKVDSVSEKLIKCVNSKLYNTNFSVCKNNNNIKLISNEINKGNTMRFILNHILKPQHVIGAGNNVLDMLFLNLCDKAYIVNSESRLAHGINVKVESQKSMEGFIKKIQDDINGK